jgi:hypothetical protein
MAPTYIRFTQRYAAGQLAIGTFTPTTRAVSPAYL